MSRNPNNMNLVNTFKAGQRYMKLCPIDNQLMHSFPELKIINHIKIATKYLPATIIGLIVWQYYMPAQLAITILTILFALSLPLQGILWLGRRSQSPLPLNLVDSYNQIKSQLVAKKIIITNKPTDRINNENPKEKLTFENFMQLIILAKTYLGDYFGQQNDN